MSTQAQIIDGKGLAKRIRSELATKVEAYEKQHGRTPHLVVILASDDPGSAIYVRSKGKAAAKAKIRSTQHDLDPSTPAEKLLELVHTLNNDDDVDGILVQLPLPKQHDAKKVISAIDPAKDVDGFHPINAGLLSRGDESGLISCTPQGIIRLLEEAKTAIEGRRATIIGRSNIVGRPIAELLLNRSATVTICHSRTKDLPARVRSADILVAAIGRANFVKGSWIKHGATVIDVGMNRDENDKLCGDVHFVAAKERARAITPVPGGVGPMTIACLLENTLVAAKRRSEAR